MNKKFTPLAIILLVAIFSISSFGIISYIKRPISSADYRQEKDKLYKDEILAAEEGIFRGKKFSSDMFNHNIHQWKEYKKYFENKPNMRGLEIGSHEGRSTLWAAINYFNGPGSTLEAIDTWGFYKELYQDPTVYNNFLFNLKHQIELGKVIPIRARSKEILLKFNLEVLDGTRKLYDFIYIDALHESRHVIEDTILAWGLLKNNGILIFDDYLLEQDNHKSSTKFALDFFMDAFMGQYEVLHKGYQLHIRKILTETFDPVKADVKGL